MDPKALPVPPVSRLNFRLILLIRTASLEVVDLTQGAFGHFEGLALGKEKIARVAATDFDDVSLRAKVGNVCRENNFRVCHRTPD